MHSNAIAEVTAKFDRQLARLKKREAAVEEAREEWNAEKTKVETEKGEVLKEISEHEAAMKSHTSLKSTIGERGKVVVCLYGRNLIPLVAGSEIETVLSLEVFFDSDGAEGRESVDLEGINNSRDEKLGKPSIEERSDEVAAVSTPT